MSQTSKLSAVIAAKCPRCRRGDLFKNSMYGFSGQKMHEHCPHCGLRYEVEPGYFYAAMYVGYAMNVALGVTIGFAVYFITKEDQSPWIYIISILSASLILAPFNFRYSRVILLHWLSPKIKYIKDYDHD